MGKTKEALSNALKSNPRFSVITPSKGLHSSLAKEDSQLKRFSDSRAYNSTERLTNLQSESSSRKSSFLEAVSDSSINGSELRQLALRLSMDLKLPHPCHAILSRSDPDSLTIADIVDFNDCVITSYTDEVIVLVNPCRLNILEGLLSSGMLHMRLVPTPMDPSAPVLR
jgi:hypothetical protein